MTAYKATIQGKRRWMMGACALLIIIVGVATWYALGVVAKENPSDRVGGFIMGAQTGIFLALLIYAVSSSVRYSRALKSEAALEKLYIAENDERSRYICDKTGSMGMNLSIALMATATLLAGFFDRTVFFTLGAALAGIVFVRAGLRLYFSHKY